MRILFYREYTAYFIFDLQSKSNVIRNRHMGKKRIFLKYRVQLSFIWRQIRNILSVKDHTAGIRCFKASQNTECGCFFRSRWVPEVSGIHFSYVKIKIIQNGLHPIRL